MDKKTAKEIRASIKKAFEKYIKPEWKEWEKMRWRR